MPWIRAYTKQHPSFARAASDREGVITSLSRELGPTDVKARIRKRPSGYDLIIWRSVKPSAVSSEAAPARQLGPRPGRMNDRAKIDPSVDLLNEAIERTLVELARRLGVPISKQELLEAHSTLLGAIVGQQLYARGWGDQSPLDSVEIYEQQGQERVH